MKIVTLFSPPVILMAMATGLAIANPQGRLRIDKTEVAVEGKGTQKDRELEIDPQQLIHVDAQSGAFLMLTFSRGLNA